jgi:hypothetical protein
VRLQDAVLDGRIVIQRNTMHYERPMADAFTASASVPDGAAWERLLAERRVTAGCSARGHAGTDRVESPQGARFVSNPA